MEEPLARRPPTVQRQSHITAMELAVCRNAARKRRPKNTAPREAMDEWACLCVTGGVGLAGAPATRAPPRSWKPVEDTVLAPPRRAASEHTGRTGVCRAGPGLSASGAPRRQPVCPAPPQPGLLEAESRVPRAGVAQTRPPPVHPLSRPQSPGPRPRGSRASLTQ